MFNLIGKIKLNKINIKSGLDLLIYNKSDEFNILKFVICEYSLVYKPIQPNKSNKPNI